MGGYQSDLYYDFPQENESYVHRIARTRKILKIALPLLKASLLVLSSPFEMDWKNTVCRHFKDFCL